MGKIVFSDIDGTLLNSKHEITQLTLIAIKKLKEQKIPFVITSSRSPSCIYPILDEYKFNVPIIAYSGALIMDENRDILFHKGFNKEKARKIIMFIEENCFNLAWGIYSFDQWIVKDKSDKRVIREENIVKVQAMQGNLDSIDKNEIHKILCICNPNQILEIEQKLKETFFDCSVVKSSDILLEIMADGISKATAVNRLCKQWNIALEETIAFGDNYNDVEMLKTVHYGYLMDNAPEKLKREISLRTLDNDHDGIYDALLKQNIILK